MTFDTGVTVGCFLTWDSRQVIWLGWAEIINLDSRPPKHINAFSRNWHELRLKESQETVWSCEVSFRSKDNTITTITNADTVFKLSWDTFLEYRENDIIVTAVHELPMRFQPIDEILENA